MVFFGPPELLWSVIQNLSSRLQPLHNLLKQKQPWSWTAACETAFEEAKQLLLGSTVLVHYDGNRPMKLACDASPYGVGAVISHIMDNGEERIRIPHTETEKKVCSN